MIIILEGPDGAGKTTLARQLCARYGLEYHHEGPPPADRTPLEHYGGLVEAARWRLQRGEIRGIVFDRLALGERVYGPIYRYNDRLGADWRIMKRLLRACDALHVVCLPAFSTCLKNWEARRGVEMLHSAKLLFDVWERYGELVEEDYVESWSVSVIYDYTKDPEAITIHSLIANPSPTLPPGIVGEPAARFLFVGEKGSQPDSPSADLPFFSLTGSSGYLTQALDDAGYREDEVAFTNAERWDGQHVPWITGHVHKIVALGRRAAIEGANRGITMIKLPHPQYWKRFKSRERDKYVEMLHVIRNY